MTEDSPIGPQPSVRPEHSTMPKEVYGIGLDRTLKEVYC